jgi:hypothetical protein
MIIFKRQKTILHKNRLEASKIGRDFMKIIHFKSHRNYSYPEQTFI